MDAVTPKVTCGAAAASHKLHRPGERVPELHVPLRLIDLHPTAPAARFRRPSPRGSRSATTCCARCAA